MEIAPIHTSFARCEVIFFSYHHTFLEVPFENLTCILYLVGNEGL